jgi:hypothetical protein
VDRALTDLGVEFFPRLSSYMMAMVASFAKVSRLLRDHAIAVPHQICDSTGTSI